MTHTSLSFPYKHTLFPNAHILGPYQKNHFIIIWTLSALVCVAWLVSPGFVPLPYTPCRVWPPGSHVAPP